MQTENFINVWNQYIKRPGADNLLAYMQEHEFFDEPASGRHHLAVLGGLCTHSLNVFERLKWLCQIEHQRNPDWEMPSMESIALVSLTHDLCKMGTHHTEFRNVKTYDQERVANAEPWMVKHDAGGDFIWESVASYRFDDPLPMGHGEKSLWLVQKFMELSDEEAFAIRYHMSSWNDGEKSNASKAFEKYRLAFLLHTADEFATFIDEVDS